MSKSTRRIHNVWARDPDAPVIVTRPRGKRTNGLIWGHTLDDFFQFPMTLGVASDRDGWSNSMIKECGENFGNQELKWEPMPRRRRPWPVLKVPPTFGADPRLGPVDEGSEHEDEHSDHENRSETLNDLAGGTPSETVNSEDIAGLPSPIQGKINRSHIFL
jgi:hypothetical protein